ncbi:hypothetical protein BZARG_1290 [Bizionia argentinensis JUB59]|uniref:Rad50/SbcC-type AAA domain-containing protein n=1 Tax=Bizionia argentinensis JUB59 TaxID=1046627 RepID=G2EDE1_9FLAO|nr:ATP-binding protein [Bizionia argentinensis]EGV43536.1 hypothetical protein BZARG_1290 [Bizionia argentinensis JUB59]
MSRIDTLQIHNFKFFNEQEAIKLDGKHLLLYGENGSGKSSIYWALYTLFEASLKNKKEDIEKYFKHHSVHPQSLVNIHTEPIYTGESLFYDSFINVKTKHTPPLEYNVSLLDTAIKDNSLAKEVNQASDFISYKVLYKFQDFWNGDKMDLADIFIGSILSYLNFPEKDLIRNGSIVKFTNASDMYKEIMNGPGITENDKGKTIQVYKNSPENKKFNVFAKHFNDELKDLIDFINVNAPTMLAKLGYDIDFELHYEELKFQKADVNFNFTPFKIEFVITKYLGKPITITRPQSFLNEAKITAIAISIRLTILRRRINTEAGDILKFIVFDDVMISLDMNNRDKLIDFLLDPANKFTEDYQLLFLTHDRSLFFYLKDKIRNVGLKDNWLYKEMYVDSLSENETPVIYNHPNKLKKAKYYIDNHDYPAAGIYLRTQCEEILDNLYPDQSKYEVSTNNDGVYETKSQNLNGKIGHLEWFCSKEGIDFVDFKDLKTYKSVILNSLAHNDLHSPIYKSELIRVYDVLEKLVLIKRDTQIAKPNDTFKIAFIKNDGTTYSVGITIKDRLMILEKDGSYKRLSNFCKANITYINDNGTETKDINIEKESIQQIVTEKCTQLGIGLINVESYMLNRKGVTVQSMIDAI